MQSSSTAGRKLFVGRWTSANVLVETDFPMSTFADLQNDPVRTLQASYVSLGLDVLRRRCAFRRAVGRRAQTRGARRT